MDYHFEIYFNYKDISKMCFKEEFIEWDGETFSQDPAVFVSENGIHFERIDDNNHFNRVTGIKINTQYIGLLIRDELISDFAWLINTDKDIFDNPITSFVMGLDNSSNYAILLYREDEVVKEKFDANSNKGVLTALLNSLDWDNPKDILINKYSTKSS